MAISKPLKQLQLKNLDQGTLNRVGQAQTHLESFRNTGFLHSLSLAIGVLNGLREDLDDKASEERS